MEKADKNRKSLLYIFMVENVDAINKIWTIPLLNSKTIIDNMALSLSNGETMGSVQEQLKALIPIQEEWHETYFYKRK